MDKIDKIVKEIDDDSELRGMEKILTGEAVIIKKIGGRVNRRDVERAQRVEKRTDSMLRFHGLMEGFEFRIS